MYLATSAYLNNHCASRKTTKSPAGEDIYAFEVRPVFRASFMPPPGGFRLPNGIRIPAGLNRNPIGPTSPSGEPWTPEPNMQPMGLFDEEGMSNLCKNKNFENLNSGLPTRKEDIDQSLIDEME